MSINSFQIVLVVSAVFDVVVALALLALMTRGGRALTIARALAAGLMMAFLCLLKTPFLARLGFNMFGLIHAAYIDLVIVLPLLAAVLLIADWRARRASSQDRPFTLRRSTRIAAAITLLAAPAIGIYATHVEPYQVQFEKPHAEVSGHRAGSATLRIGVLADIQTHSVGAFEHQAIEALMATQPDLIIIPGDLLQVGGTYPEQLSKMRDLLARLHAPAGVYFVSGDCEWRDGGVEIIEGLHITHLHNRIVTIEYLDRTITIGGTELDCHLAPARRVIADLESRAGESDVRILVSHRPDAVLNASSNSRIDLFIAGHTHGGQVCVPLFGPPITLSEVPRAVAAGGLSNLNDNQIYVSRGLGHEGGQAPRIRFNCPPEITLLTLADETAAPLSRNNPR